MSAKNVYLSISVGKIFAQLHLMYIFAPASLRRQFCDIIRQMKKFICRYKIVTGFIKVLIIHWKIVCWRIEFSSRRHRKNWIHWKYPVDFFGFRCLYFFWQGAKIPFRFLYIAQSKRLNHKEMLVESSYKILDLILNRACLNFVNTDILWSSFKIIILKRSHSRFCFC